MSGFQFVKATKKQAKARIAIDGPSGSGKTYTSLIAATALAKGGKIAVIDTERGSASLYSEKFDFDVLELNPPFSPEVYHDAIKAAENAGYAVIVIDSLSHAWEGEGGALDMADDATKRQKTQNSYTAWREVTPIHRAMVDAILQSKCHVVVTMRSKMEYVQEKNSDGRTVINKVGMAPIQRSGMEYEFTIVGDMDLDNTIVISKSRYEPFSGRVQKKPGVEFFKSFVDWLNSGEAKDTTTVAPRVSGEPESVIETQLVKETPKPNGGKYARPMSPETLKEALQKKAASAKPASEKQTNLARILLLEHFADREDERHQAQEYLTGRKSFKDIEPEMISAILDWMKPTPNIDGSGSYELNKDAKIELTMVARQFMADLGQQKLEI
jgi:KaiC/GvpD/RAD55 family RecA-like ATPase